MNLTRTHDMATIRQATAEDIDGVLVLARNFYAATAYGEMIGFDDESFIATFQNLLQGDGVCLIAEVDGRMVGYTGALAYPFYFNSNHKTGQELFWWVEPEARGSSVGSLMFKALESWAKDRGCKTFSMIALDALKPDALAKVYKRAGYKASEHTFIKEL